MSSIDDLISTVAALRVPETGCPWDIEQTHQSITDCLIDECCELLQTIDRLDMHHMEEELGDVLLQVVMHAQMAQEAGHSYPIVKCLPPIRYLEVLWMSGGMG